MRDADDPVQDEEVPGVSLRTGLSLSELDISQLWIAYLGLGGTMSAEALEDALRGGHTLSAHEHDLVAQSLNDYFTERGQDHPVAYSDEVAEHHRPET